MCGILGLIHYGPSRLQNLQAQMYRKVIGSLLKESQIRGHDASGLFVIIDDAVSMFKHNVPADCLVETDGYHNVIDSIKSGKNFRAMIGHTRAKTKGSQRFNVNNHPILANRILGVHNGMIYNDEALFKKYRNKLKRSGEVDSEIIFRLIDMYLRTEPKKDLVSAVIAAHQHLSGSYACAFTHLDNPRYVTIFKNGVNSYSGVSLYIFKALKLMIFASTEYILQRALKNTASLDPSFVDNKINIGGSGLRIDTETGKIHKFELEDSWPYNDDDDYYSCLVGC